MANWNKIVITNAGMQLSTSTLAGSKIQYTHVQTTSTNLTTLTHDQLVALTKLDTVVQDLNIGTVSVADDHTVTIPVQVNNQDVTADYNLYGMAIFAKPVDGAEIIYGVAVATAPDLIPAKGGTTVTSTDFNMKVHVGDTSNVDITVAQQMGVNSDYVTDALKPYVLTTAMNTALGNYVLKTALPDFTTFEKVTDLNTTLKSYATNNYVDDQIAVIPKPDMTAYDTIVVADGKYQPKGSYAASADLTALQKQVATDETTLSGKADATDLTTLASKVTANGTSIADIQKQQTTDETTLGTKAAASDVTTLAGKVTTNTTNIATNAKDISTLQTQQKTDETTLGTKAAAADLTTLSGKVTTNTTSIGTNAASIKSLQTQQTADETTLAGKASTESVTAAQQAAINQAATMDTALEKKLTPWVGTQAEFDALTDYTSYPDYIVVVDDATTTDTTTS